MAIIILIVAVFVSRLLLLPSAVAMSMVLMVRLVAVVRLLPPAALVWVIVAARASMAVGLE